MKTNGTELPVIGQRAVAQGPVSFVYSVDHEVSDLMRVAELLRGRGIVMLPSVGTSYMMSDANAWESPDERVAIRTRETGVMHPRTVMLPGEYTSLDEYADAVARAVLGELEQCLADGCMRSEDGGGSGYCSGECFARSEPEWDDEDDSVEEAFLDPARPAQDLLRAVVEALTLPLPVDADGDVQEYLWSLTRRARLVQESVAAALDPEDAAGLAMATEHVRTQASWQDGSYRAREGGA